MLLVLLGLAVRRGTLALLHGRANLPIVLALLSVASLGRGARDGLRRQRQPDPTSRVRLAKLLPHRGDLGSTKLLVDLGPRAPKLGGLRTILPDGVIRLPEDDEGFRELVRQDDDTVVHVVGEPLRVQEALFEALALAEVRGDLVRECTGVLQTHDVRTFGIELQLANRVHHGIRILVRAREDVGGNRELRDDVLGILERLDHLLGHCLEVVGHSVVAAPVDHGDSFAHLGRVRCKTS